MSHSRDAAGFIVAEWEAALKDARVSPADYRLITGPGAPASDRARAVSFRRGYAVDGSEGGIVVTNDKLLEAKQFEQLNRVATFADWDETDPVQASRRKCIFRHGEGDSEDGGVQSKDRSCRFLDGLRAGAGALDRSLPYS